MFRVSGRISAAVLALVAIASAASAADRYDPRLRFRTTRTAHFDIHAHQGEEALARRLAIVAERVRVRLASVLGTPRGRVQVILVDQSDLSNGWATPFPYDAIEITAAPPAAESLIGNTTDWLELVFTHEYTHIVHLDRTRGFMQGVRAVFGRVPLAFPNAFLPTWQIEGLATFEESQLTGQGRVNGGDFRAIVDVAAAHGRFEPIDRAEAGLTDWPGGNAPYLYGALFQKFLADRFGPERLARLADATAGRVPLLGAGAFKKVFGRSAEDLWREFRSSRERSVAAAGATDARATRLTHHGFTVTAPASADDGSLFYLASNPHGYPALMRLRGGETSRVAWRALGGRTSVRSKWIVFDQLERTRSVAVFSDLYVVRTDGGEVHRLTRDARAADPDLSPDGGTIVCTVQAGGRRGLALVDFSADAAMTPRPLVDEPDSDFSGPRWSPDGRHIAATRRRPEGFDLVIVDAATAEVRSVLKSSGARLATPSWSAGGDALLFAAAPANEPFNILSIDLASGTLRQLTDTRGGAQFPELRGNTLTYVGYTADGYDLFSTPYAPTAPAQSLDSSTTLAGESGLETGGPAFQADAAYRPLRTLVPTYWSPLLASDAGEVVIGAGTAMADVLGRHSYVANAGWAGGRGRPEWNVAYAYDRWRPTIFAAYSDDTDPVRGGEIRSRELFAGAQIRFRRLRSSDTILAGLDVERATIDCTGSCRITDPERDFRSIRGGWLRDSRRQFGYSISSEEGMSFAAGVESSRTALGSDANAGALVLDARGFRRLGSGHSVLAARAALAASWGDAGMRRVFSAAGPGRTYAGFDFGRDAIGLLRGFDPEEVLGTRAFTASLDLRFPIARPQRGLGTWPAFIHSLHAAVFADAGHGWDRTFRARDIKTAAGAELSTNLVVLHNVPLTVAAGAAWTRDGAADRHRASFFGRLGYAF